MSLRRAGILWNTSKPETIPVAAGLRKLLLNKGVSVQYGGDAVHKEDFKDSDVLFVLGGDGTILSSMDIGLEYEIPICGINMGHVGFLAESEPDDLEEMIDRFISQDIPVEKRMLLVSDASHLPALNEFAIMPKMPGRKVIHCRLYINGTYYDTFSGDGLIVSTPTGSTGYSLSAGGPVISPELYCVLVTPVCSRKLSARPIILPADTVVRVVAEGDASLLETVIDGRCSTDMSPEGIEIRKYEKAVRLVHIADYFTTLRGKLINKC